MNTLDKIIAELTIEEKASLLYGDGFWSTHAVERLGISAITMSDGPHGLRRQEGNVDNIGMMQSLPATCFPTASALGSSFDVDLIFELGKVLASECKDQNVDILLGPGINIKRSPLCGRNFEYFSEDPYLSGVLATAFINGVQKHGVGTCLKHFAVNNQEKNRQLNNSVVDQRTLHEMYLKAFAIAIQNAQPYTVMSSYNMVNDVYASENSVLLEDILREQFQYQGVVISDWGAVNDSIHSYANGLNIEMPGMDKSKRKVLVHAMKKNLIAMETVDKRIKDILVLHEKIKEGRTQTLSCDYQENAKFAQLLSENSTVLLKNENDILPIALQEIAVIGEFAKEPRYQGAGSSNVNPYQLDNFLQVLQENKISYRYAKGYHTDNEEVDAALVLEAVDMAQASKTIIVLAGLPKSFESEGYDRVNLAMPQNQLHLIDELSKKNKNIIVVLQTGSPVQMPFLDNVSAILLQYLSGSFGAHALYNILTGATNPSGHLAETFPLEDMPVHNFPNPNRNVYYHEGEYIGYKYYEAFEKEVLFPFGFGLSYAKFLYHNCSINHEQISVEVENKSAIDGKVVLQVYVVFQTKDKKYKSLRAFQKIEVQAWKKKNVTFNVTKDFFSFYDVEQNKFVYASGNFEVQIATSAKDTIHSQMLTIEGEKDYVMPSFPVELETYPEIKFNKKGQFTTNSTIKDISTSFWGRQFANIIRTMANKMIEKDPSAKDLVEKLIDETPMRMFAQFSNGKLNGKAIDVLICLLNGHLFKAIKRLLTH